MKVSGVAVASLLFKSFSNGFLSPIRSTKPDPTTRPINSRQLIAPKGLESQQRIPFVTAVAGNDVEGKPESSLEAITTPNYKKEDLEVHHQALVAAVEAHPTLSLDLLKSVDLLTLLHGSRAVCSLNLNPGSDFGIPVEARRGVVPEPFLRVGSDEFYAIVEKICLIYNKDKVSALLDLCGLSDWIDIDSDVPFTEQFLKNSLPEDLENGIPNHLKEGFKNYLKEFVLGLLHGIDPVNASACAAMSAWGRGGVIITPQVAQTLGFEYTDLSKVGTHFYFSEENQGYLVDQSYFKGPDDFIDETGSDDFGDFDDFMQYDQIQIDPDIMNPEVNAQLNAGPLQTMQYQSDFQMPQPRSVDQSLQRRPIDKAACDKSWAQWCGLVSDLKDVAGLD